eukprot:maker-scaffold630_size122347-snap-gene-0.13 protein:Tk08032 transcript:maker-scaffold630_size122347-snap-gene-0.13-mRNA-1 annotation:"hypothetical protein BRAFLDRAFT_235528"
MSSLIQTRHNRRLQFTMSPSLAYFLLFNLVPMNAHITQLNLARYLNPDVSTAAPTNTRFTAAFPCVPACPPLRLAEEGFMLDTLTPNECKRFSFPTGFDGKYVNAAADQTYSCTFGVQVSSGYVANVTFSTFDLENEASCQSDSLSLFGVSDYCGDKDGNASDGTAKLCGTLDQEGCANFRILTPTEGDEVRMTASFNDKNNAGGFSYLICSVPAS